MVGQGQKLKNKNPPKGIGLDGERLDGVAPLASVTPNDFHKLGRFGLQVLHHIFVDLFPRIEVDFGFVIEGKLFAVLAHFGHIFCQTFTGFFRVDVEFSVPIIVLEYPIGVLEMSIFVRVGLCHDLILTHSSS